jgi:hypothetical protein
MTMNKKVVKRNPLSVSIKKNSNNGLFYEQDSTPSNIDMIGLMSPMIMTVANLPVRTLNMAKKLPVVRTLTMGPKAKTPKAKTTKAKTPKAKTPKAKTTKAKTPKAKTTKAKTPKAKKTKTPN